MFGRKHVAIPSNRYRLYNQRMDAVLRNADTLEWNGRHMRCAVGRGGIRADKREGDGATPVGRFPFRRLLYRADRLERPPGVLPVQAIARDDGWCDDPAHGEYNRQVRLPFAAGHERLWRDDRLYDLVVVLGHNDDPPAPGAGSAIFLHVAGPDYPPTRGCVAVALADLQRIVAECGAETALRVIPPPT